MDEDINWFIDGFGDGWGDGDGEGEGDGDGWDSGDEDSHMYENSWSDGKSTPIKEFRQQ